MNGPLKQDLHQIFYSDINKRAKLEEVADILRWMLEAIEEEARDARVELSRYVANGCDILIIMEKAHATVASLNDTGIEGLKDAVKTALVCAIDPYYKRKGEDQAQRISLSANGARMGRPAGLSMLENIAQRLSRLWARVF
jgi:hypothetical protein